MFKKTIAVLALILMFENGSSNASTIAGIGDVKCDQWTIYRKYEQSTLVFGAKQWILGFLSGMASLNATLPNGAIFDPLSDTDEPRIFNYVDNYCQTNPTDTLLHTIILFSGYHIR